MRQFQKRKTANVSVTARFAPLLLALAVSGCATSVTSFESLCALMDPIILSDQAIDALTDEDATQIESHNATWIEHCATWVSR